MKRWKILKEAILIKSCKKYTGVKSKQQKKLA
jgi:hypothetical protein